MTFDHLGRSDLYRSGWFGGFYEYWKDYEYYRENSSGRSTPDAAVSAGIPDLSGWGYDGICIYDDSRCNRGSTSDAGSTAAETDEQPGRIF